MVVLSNGVNRIGITDKRLSYLKEKQVIGLVYNDYSNQQQGQAAPKSINWLDPLTFIHQLMQHVLPKHFQKSRHYGLHNVSTALRSKIPESVKRNGQTLRTIFEIITDLLKENPLNCVKCGSSEFTKEEIRPNKKWIIPFIYPQHNNKSPPKKQPQSNRMTIQKKSLPLFGIGIAMLKT
jgi:predicted nucleic-acid-binding Zn-ribbon protein